MKPVAERVREARDDPEFVAEWHRQEEESRANFRAASAAFREWWLANPERVEGLQQIVRAIHNKTTPR